MKHFIKYFLAVIVIIGISACYAGDSQQASLGEPFTLTNNEPVRIGDIGLEIEIINFINSPCPKGAQCFWSGLGVEFEYRLNGQTKKGLNLTEAFGYRVEIIRTDYKTSAEIIVDQIRQ